MKKKYSDIVKGLTKMVKELEEFGQTCTDSIFEKQNEIKEIQVEIHETTVEMNRANACAVKLKEVTGL